MQEKQFHPNISNRQNILLAVPDHCRIEMNKTFSQLNYSLGFERERKDIGNLIDQKRNLTKTIVLEMEIASKSDFDRLYKIGEPKRLTNLSNKKKTDGKMKL